MSYPQQSSGTLDRNFSISINITLLNNPGKSHVFMCNDKLIYYSLCEDGNYSIKNFDVKFLRNFLKIYIKKNIENTKFWLIPSDEENEGFGTFFEIDPNVIRRPQDFNSPKIMFRALNPDGLALFKGVPYEKQLELIKFGDLCKHCGKTFFPIDSRQLYCSKECRNAEYITVRRKMTKKTPITRCRVCGGIIQGTKRKRYCGDECRKRHYRSKNR